jgi:ribose transport system ATP-binding protein
VTNSASKGADQQVVPPLLTVRGVKKRYGSIAALRGVNLEIRAGEIHGLVGANGAGKSTLVKIMAGVEQPDDGEILLRDEPVEIHDPHQASEFGFGFIHQELNLIESFTAAQNIEMGNLEVTSRRPRNFAKVSAPVRDAARKLGIKFPLDVPVSRLRLHQKWLVTIARALVLKQDLIVMDEPTASLSRDQAEHLMHVVQQLAGSGAAILYVSHRLDEILETCDRVTVFRDGAVTSECVRGQYSRKDVVAAITGSEAGLVDASSLPGETAPSDDEILRLTDVERLPQVRGVSLALRRGEVLGLAGLVGSGRTELARIVFGVDAAARGEMLFKGAAYDPSGVQDAVAAGVAYVPEERRSQGLFMQQNTEFNLNIGKWADLRVVRWLPITSKRKSRELVVGICDDLRIKSARPSTPVGHLSGGNQQKVLMGKWLAQGPDVLILDEPTRGVDVAGKSEIHRRVRDMAQAGAGVIMISSELEDLLICDRVLVMARGRVVGELAGDEITVDQMLSMSYG